MYKHFTLLLSGVKKREVLLTISKHFFKHKGNENKENCGVWGVV